MKILPSPSLWRAARVPLAIAVLLAGHACAYWQPILAARAEAAAYSAVHRPPPPAMPVYSKSFNGYVVGQK